MKHDRRIQRLEELMAIKKSTDPVHHFEFTKEEAQQIYGEAGKKSEPLYVKMNNRYVNIDDLNSKELQSTYKDFIDDRIKLFDEADLKRIG